MTEKKMKDCGASASKANGTDDETTGDCEGTARIDLVAIDPDELPDLIKFGNHRVREKAAQLARKIGCDLF